MYDHISTMHLLASQLKELQHSAARGSFAVASTAGLFGLTDQITGLHYPALVVVDDVSARLNNASNSDNLLITSSYMFAVLVQGDVADALRQQKAMAEAQGIAKKIISRLFLHQRRRELGLTNLQRNGITFQAIGPTMDGCWGCLVTISVLEDAGIKYIEDEWITTQ